MGKKFLVVVWCCGLVLWIFKWLVGQRYANSMLNTRQVEGDGFTVVVLGAAVVDGYPTDALRDRLDTTVDLYEQGVVTRVLLSGGHAEPAVMKAYIVQHGVPSEIIIVDDLGLRTFDSCERTRRVFGIKYALFVTQAFHLPRTLFIAEMLGIQAQGIIADRETYRDASWYELREMLALIAAMRDILLAKLHMA